MRKLLLTLLMAVTTLGAHAQLFSVNTDALMDLCLAPNVGFELVTGNRSSISANVLFAIRPLGMKGKIKAVQPEYRYYFSGRPMNRWFVGGGLVGAIFDVTRKGKVYDGYALGAGLTFGYVLNLTNRLNIDFHSGFGFVYYNRKEYFEHDNFDVDFAVDGVGQANAKGYYLMPTRFGISVTYILF